MSFTTNTHRHILEQECNILLLFVVPPLLLPLLFVLVVPLGAAGVVKPIRVPPLLFTTGAPPPLLLLLVMPPALPLLFVTAGTTALTSFRHSTWITLVRTPSVVIDIRGSLSSPLARAGCVIVKIKSGGRKRCS